MSKPLLSKSQAGRKGGFACVAKHGREHMQAIGKRGAAVTWDKYHLAPIGQSGWAIVDRRTNEVKTFVNYIPGRKL
jgi:hypothetical protein